MAKEWKVRCKDCGEEFGYSDWSYRASASRGQSRPERCSECRKKHNRQTGLMGLAYFDLRPRAQADTGTISVGSLGALTHPPREHAAIELPSGFDPNKFGVTDDDIRALFAWLDDPKHQVAVVVGPTGSGKSTALPYRLIHPPEGIEEDRFTRYGQVLVTQPRIQATRNIPAYVAKDLYGSSMGSGYDVGFRYKNHPYSDWRNRLVYATDGTVINWIVSGQIANLSVIMIDEAHERSLNIDLILGLLKKLLPRYPHLKLIVASATIDSGLFIDYFGAATAKLIEFQGKRKFNVETHFMEPSSALPYDTLPKLMRMVPTQVADRVVWLLEQIAAGGKPSGDILAFLQGEKPIEQAVAAIRQAVKANVALGNVDVYPLYTTLQQEEQNKALLKKPDPSRRRVVVTTNVAETSLTVEDIVYVVDSGLINEARWDPDSQTKQIVAVLHSQAGCKQRWGRGGRVRDGQAYCLYTEEQFRTLFPEYTVPQIQRSDLETVVLAAKAAGIDDLSTFDWIQKPPDSELERAPRALTQIYALDDQGDLTEHGLELQSFGEEPEMAHLMATADRFACAVEMATLLPMIKLGGPRFLLRTDRKWDATTKRAVDEIHRALKKGCTDDIEFCLKLYAAWSQGHWDGHPLAPGWAVLREWARLMPPFSRDMKTALGDRERSFREACFRARNAQELTQLVTAAGIEEAARTWLTNAATAFLRARRAAWAKVFFINENVFRDKIELERNALLDALSGHKKDDERRPIDFELLTKLRILFAYALPGRAYELSGDEVEGANDPAPTGSGLGYQLRGPAVRPLGAASAAIVQINADSVCFGRSPRAFVCGKQQILVHPIEPDGKPVSVMHVSHLVAVEPSWLDAAQLAQASTLALARFISQETRDSQSGLLRPSVPARRLFLDLQVPLGSRYECVVQAIDGENGCRLQVIGLVREQREVMECSRGEEPEVLVADETEVGEPGELVDTVLTPTDVLVENPDEDPVHPWEDLTDDSPLADDEQGTSEQPQHREAAVFVEDEAFTRLAETFSARLIETAMAYAVGQQIVTEVVDYDYSGVEPVVLVRPVPEHEPFEVFVQHYKVGDQVTVSVVGYDERPLDYLVSLVVREPISQLEVLLGPEEISFMNRSFIVKEIPIGTQLATILEMVDVARQRVYLSGFLALEQLLDTVIQKQRSTTGRYEVEGVVKEIAQERAYFLLNWSEPTRGLVLTAMVAGKGLHKGSIEAYQVGETCRLQLKFSENDMHVRLDDLPESIKPLLGVQRAFRNLSWQDGTLYYHGRMTYASRRELQAASADPKYNRSLSDLYRFSNLFWASTVDNEWAPRAAKYHVGDQVEGQVTEVVPFGAFVELEPGLRGLVHIKNMAWGFVKDPAAIVGAGQTVRAQIIEMDVEQRRLGLTMRIPENDPFARYKVGDRVQGEVTGIKEYGAFVEVELGVGGLIHRTQMVASLDVGDRVEVQVLVVDSEKRRHNYRLVRIVPAAEVTRSVPDVSSIARRTATPHGPNAPTANSQAETGQPPEAQIRPDSISASRPTYQNSGHQQQSSSASQATYRRELQLSTNSLQKLTRRSGGLFGALLGSGHTPLEEIKNATGTDIQINTSTGLVVIIGGSQDAVDKAALRLKSI